MSTSNLNLLKGGEFLIKTQSFQDTFIREELNNDALEFASMIKEFIDKKVAPNFAKIDKGGYDLLVQLLKEAGDLGMLNAGLPEEYGGMNVDFNTETVMSEELGKSHSFSVACAAHTGIGTLPILYFGTEEQKKTYLSALGSGEKMASYCLTEPWSGSDAMGARTKAVLSDDGEHYILNGQKMWITNAGFADIFIVFAQVDGTKFTGFIVDKETPGLSLGAEEDKMGIKGSSTRQVFFENVKIPKTNLLGELGKGHKIAFNVLNIGRYKLCIMAMGGAKETFQYGVKYAIDRQQFGKSISEFGAIKNKIAEMAISIYATESACYRVGGLIENMITELVAGGMTRSEAKLQAAEEYSIECAALKVMGSETLDFVADETVQIYGGMGFSEEAPAARSYRDSRINRIFEGTNEINRLLAVSSIVRKAMRGKLDLLGPATQAQKDLLNIDFGDDTTELFSIEKKTIAQAKKAILLAAGGALEAYKLEFENQQEVIMRIADMSFDAFAAESILLRVEKLVSKNGLEANIVAYNIMQSFFSDAMDRIYINGKNIIGAYAEGDMLTMMFMGMKRFTKYPILNSVKSKRIIADHFLEMKEYKI